MAIDVTFDIVSKILLVVSQRMFKQHLKVYDINSDKTCNATYLVYSYHIYCRQLIKESTKNN